MDKSHFNLVDDPWIKVLTRTDEIETVSLRTLFAHAQDYRQLAGEMRVQDFVVMRLLLAILHTVYSRYDESGHPYDWLDVDDETMRPTTVDEDEDNEDVGDDLLATWQALQQVGHFTPIIATYLAHYQARFDFFGEQPFYQVTAEQFDRLVPADHRIATGKGTVDIKQIDRRVSESGNSRAVFAPKTEAYKNTMTIPELVRWVITYQNFTGVTDKTKVKAPEKFSVSMGWPYRLNPVYVEGQTLFETLLLNLVLVPDDGVYHLQRPQWEFPDQEAYVHQTLKALLPDNVAQLYTLWSRILHIEWDEVGRPTIFSGGLPSPEVAKAFVEPMTTWKWAAKDKPPAFKPARKSTASLGRAMWRNFGQYVAVHHDQETASETHQPGVVSWLALLDRKDLLPQDHLVHLVAITLISDGNATSQAPAAELVDDMTIDAAVLFDDVGAVRWPVRIEDAVAVTQKVGSDFYHFVSEVATIRGITDSAFASRQSARFYARLDAPFKAWLAGLKPEENRDQKLIAWKKQLRRIVSQVTEGVTRTATTRDLRGITIEKNGEKQHTNIVLANRRLQRMLKHHLQ